MAYRCELHEMDHPPITPITEHLRKKHLYGDYWCQHSNELVSPGQYSSSSVFCFHLNLAGIMFKLILAKLCLFSYLHRVTRLHH